MGLFSSKEEKMDKLMKEYELPELSEKDYKLMKAALSNFSISVSTAPLVALSGKSIDQVQMSNSNTIVYQNWLIIKQLARLNDKLDQLLQR